MRQHAEALRGNPRGDVLGASGLNVILGLWLIASPFLLDWLPGDAPWNPVVFGLAATILALVRVSGASEALWLSLLNFVIGVWLFASGFWLAETVRAQWDLWLCGGMLAMLAVSSAVASEERIRSRGRRVPY